MFLPTPLPVWAVLLLGYGCTVCRRSSGGLLEVQNNMSAKLHAAYVGKTVRVLVDGESDDPEYPLTSRTEGNRLVRLKGDKALIGQFADVAVTGSNTWALYGEAV